jgi:hypothetical protein
MFEVVLCDEPSPTALIWAVPEPADLTVHEADNQCARLEFILRKTEQDKTLSGGITPSHG